MLGQHTILLVEDEDSLRESLAILLELDGYIVVEAKNGYEALKYLSNHERPSIVISDVNMPVMDGLHLLQLMKARDMLSDIPVIIMSANRENKTKALALGARFLDKPFLVEELESMIQGILSPGI